MRGASAIKPIFRRNTSLHLRALVLVLAACVLLVAERKGLAVPFRSALTSLVYPVQQAVSVPTRLVSSAREAFSSYAGLFAENQRLRDEQLILKTRLMKFATLEQENIRLRGLLETSFKVGEQMQIAEVLSVNLFPFEQVLVVNKGARFGAHVSQPVFGATGVVGQIVRVSPVSAEVLLITDSNHGIPVQVNRNGLRTVAVGTGQLDQLALPYLSGSADIQPGDLLVTSGMGGIFPPGYPVATVTDVAAQGSPFAKVVATPVARLDLLREVLLVWSKADPVPRVPEPPSAALGGATHTEASAANSHDTRTR
ncbi:rod shape-determining protein MreC [Methylolobus aquaticus]|nr:rod shape-determining protein MreC [Methylolobus aquaticus]